MSNKYYYCMEWTWFLFDPTRLHCCWPCSPSMVLTPYMAMLWLSMCTPMSIVNTFNLMHCSGSIFCAWCVHVMQWVPGCATVCTRWMVTATPIALYLLDVLHRAFVSQSSRCNHTLPLLHQPLTCTNIHFYLVLWNPLVYALDLIDTECNIFP